MGLEQSSGMNGAQGRWGAVACRWGLARPTRDSVEWQLRDLQTSESRPYVWRDVLPALPVFVVVAGATALRRDFALATIMAAVLVSSVAVHLSREWSFDALADRVRGHKHGPDVWPDLRQLELEMWFRRAFYATSTLACIGFVASLL